MKIKTAHEAAGIGPGHRYLGHFAKPKYINQGHNDVPMTEKRGTVTIKNVPPTVSDSDAIHPTKDMFPRADTSREDAMIRKERNTTRDRNFYDPATTVPPSRRTM